MGNSLVGLGRGLRVWSVQKRGSGIVRRTVGMYWFVVEEGSQSALCWRIVVRLRKIPVD